MSDSKAVAAAAPAAAAAQAATAADGAGAAAGAGAAVGGPGAADAKASRGGGGGGSDGPKVTHFKLQPRDPNKPFVPKVIPKPPGFDQKGKGPAAVQSYNVLMTQEREGKVWHHRICTLNEEVFKAMRELIQLAGTPAAAQGFKAIADTVKATLRAAVGPGVSIGVIFGSAIKDFHSAECSSATAPGGFTEDVIVYLLTDANAWDSKQLTFIRRQAKGPGVVRRAPLPADEIFEALFKKDFTKPVAGAGAAAGATAAGAAAGAGAGACGAAATPATGGIAGKARAAPMPAAPLAAAAMVGSGAGGPVVARPPKAPGLAAGLPPAHK